MSVAQDDQQGAWRLPGRHSLSIRKFWKLDQHSRSPNHHGLLVSSWCPSYYFWREFPFTLNNFPRDVAAGVMLVQVHEYAGSPLDLSFTNPTILHTYTTRTLSTCGFKTRDMESWHIGRQKRVETDRTPFEVRQCFLLFKEKKFLEFLGSAVHIVRVELAGV